MKLIRNAAVVATSTVVITMAAAVTGIGSTAAQAYEVSTVTDTVSLSLTAAETTQAAASDGYAQQLCLMAVQQEPFKDMNLFNCSPAVSACSRQAPGKPVTVVFDEGGAVYCRWTS